MVGDCRARLAEIEAGSVQCCVTSPPYFGLRDYGVTGQIGLEQSPGAYVAEMVDVFRHVRRALSDDGTVWLNLGDSYAGGKQGRGDAGRNFTGGGGNILGSGNPGNGKQRAVPPGAKPKDLLMMPARVALALQADGWYLRSQIIWAKPNPMPESVRDRPTNAHESVFLLTKRERYAYYADAVREPNCAAVQQALERYKDDPRVAEARRKGNKGAAPDRADSAKMLRITNNAFGNPAGRNLRNVWTIAPRPFKGAHFATFPPEIARRCIKAGSVVGDTVMDPFFGAGTVGLVAEELGRHCVGLELNADYARLAADRIGLAAAIDDPAPVMAEAAE